MNSERKINRLTLVFVLSAFFCTLAAIILRTVNILNFYDADIGYYKKAAMPIVMNAWLLCSVIAFFALNLLLNKKSALAQVSENSLFFKVSSGICAFGTIAVTVSLISHSAFSKLSLLMIIVAVACATYFALYLLKQVPSYNAIFALSPILICVIILGVTYFDIYTQMNSPHKMLIHFACIGCMLGFLAEARFLADKKRKKLYLFCVSSALLFSGATSIPSIILYLSKTFKYPYVDYDLFFLVFFIYFAARMITLCLPEKAKTDRLASEENQ